MRAIVVLIVMGLLVSVGFCATIYTAPAAQCTGTAAEDATSSNAIGNPTKLSFVMADLAAEGQIASGDTIQFAAGTYSVAGGDFANTGIAAYDGVTSTNNFVVNFKSASGNPEDTIIDFIGVSAGVEGFNIISTGMTIFDGLTIKNSNATSFGNEAEVEKTDGALRMTSCIIGSDGGGFNLVTIHSVTATATAYAKDCEFYGAANDGISAKDDGAVATTQNITATNCHFHDIDTASSSQGITIHGGGTARAVYCKFIDCGLRSEMTGGAIGNDDDENNSAYLYGCYVKDSSNACISPGAIEVANCYLENSNGIYPRGTSAATASLYDCVIYESIPSAIPHTYYYQPATRTSNGSILRTAFYLQSTHTNPCISVLEDTTDTVASFTISDCFINSIGTTARMIGSIALPDDGDAILYFTNNVFKFAHSDNSANPGYFSCRNGAAVVFNFSNNIFIAPSGEYLTRSDAGSSQIGTYNYYSTGLDDDSSARWAWGATDTVSTEAALLAKFPFFTEFNIENNYKYYPATMSIGAGVSQPDIGGDVSYDFFGRGQF